ncbi:MAG: GNAT family N-acetyltransferase [Methylocystaceae bacterium]|nr:MAG: GNAT family N-acetyltransferase [Methylocystaceae bacterium]
MSLSARRLDATDAAAFQALRLEGFRLQEREFRFAPEDEAGFALTDIGARLARDFVMGVFAGGRMIGVAGLTRFAGVKVRHKALLWGMYVRVEFRGSGAADMLMSAIVEHADGLVETITLTVIAENRRAIRFYERWGFAIHGVEPVSVKLPNGDYLGEALMIRRHEGATFGASAAVR